MINVYVGKGHIQRAKEFFKRNIGLRCANCPVALALKDKGYSIVLVTGANVNLEGATYSLPPAVCKFVRAFDNNKPVGPFSFRFKGPSV